MAIAPTPRGALVPSADPGGRARGRLLNSATELPDLLWRESSCSNRQATASRTPPWQVGAPSWLSATAKHQTPII